MDTGSTPVWSIEKRMLENTEVFGIFFISVFRRQDEKEQKKEH